MQDASIIQRIETKYHSLSTLMDERMRRQWAASEATAYGWGGIQAVAHATGLSPTTIRKAQAELARLQGILPDGMSLQHVYDLDRQNSAAIASTFGAYLVDYRSASGRQLQASPTKPYDLVLVDVTTGLRFKPAPGKLSQKADSIILIGEIWGLIRQWRQGKPGRWWRAVYRRAS